jgi:hypothetical protein
MVKRGPKIGAKKAAPKKRDYKAERRRAAVRKLDADLPQRRQQQREEWWQRYIAAVNERLYKLPYETRREYAPPAKLWTGSVFEREVTVTESYRDESGKLRKRKTKVKERYCFKPPEPNHCDWIPGYEGLPPPLDAFCAMQDALKPETRDLLKTSRAYRRLVNEAGWYPKMPHRTRLRPNGTEWKGQAVGEDPNSAEVE